MGLARSGATGRLEHQHPGSAVARLELAGLNERHRAQALPTGAALDVDSEFRKDSVPARPDAGHRGIDVADISANRGVPPSR